LVRAQWRGALLDSAAEIFERGGKKSPEVDEETVRALYAKIGELVVTNDFCPKGSNLGFARRAMIEKNHLSLSVGAQCRLLSISR
jgi:hypothetical protein